MSHFFAQRNDTACGIMVETLNNPGYLSLMTGTPKRDILLSVNYLEELREGIMFRQSISRSVTSFPAA
jgi:hypothetical protein